MRLVGFEFGGAAGPLSKGFLELGDVTVLFGANDVGKSRLLNTVVDGALGLERLLEGREPAGEHRFHIDLGPEDADRLLTATYHLERDEGDEASGRTEGGRSGWLQQIGSPEHREQLRRSNLFALKALGDWCGKAPNESPGLLVEWCFDGAPIVSPSASGRNGVPVGTIDLPLLPVPVHVPSVDPSQLRSELSDTLNAWLAHFLWACSNIGDLKALGARALTAPSDEVTDEWLDLAADFARRVDDRPGAELLWTVRDSDDGSVALRPLARTACGHVSELATRLAPEFIRDRYRIVVRPRDVLDWKPEEPVDVTVESVADGSRFDHGALADGLRLWVEIALFEASDAMRRSELTLREAFLRVEDAVYEAPQDLPQAVDDYIRHYDDASARAVDPPFNRTITAAFAFARGVDNPWSDGEPSAPTRARRLAAARPRLYVLDEPERHLNPRLQRMASRWLVDLLRTRGSQGLIATHCPAFLTAGLDTRYVEIRRGSDGRSEIEPFVAEDVTALSRIAAEVGLDRGELLGNVAVLLFVEGRHDQAVLETLFARRLQRAGVVVVPIAGAGKHAQIVEHEVLVRFTRARLAVVLDKLEASVVTRLLEDEQFRQESLRSRQTELQAMASLLQNAVANQRDVQPFALPVDDIFDALDSDLVVDQFPRYPGHVDARRAWEAQTKVTNRKMFYEERFGITNDIATYRMLAALMREFDRIPDELLDLAADLERLAFDSP